jgi:hypothetical protein
MSNVNSLLNSALLQNQSLNNSLANNQRKQLDDILKQYDASNFTQKDFKKLGDELKAAGIKPGQEVKNAIEAKGINVEQYLPQSAKTTSSVSSNSTYGPPYRLDLSNPAQQIVDGQDPCFQADRRTKRNRQSHF